MTTALDLATPLRELLTEHGPEVAEDRARLLGLLRERVPDQPRAVNLLVTALDCGVPARLRAGTGALASAEASAETDRMVQQYGTDADAARGAVETWAMALGRAVPVAPPPTEPPGITPGSAPVDAPPLRSGVVLPLPGTAGPPPAGIAVPQRVLPLPGTAAAIHRAGPRVAWRVAVPLGAILIAGGLWAAGPLRNVWRGPAPLPAPTPTPAPPPAGGDRTPEGYVIATVDDPPRFQGKPIDGNPNTLLVVFGLRVGAAAFTYQAAVGFEGRGPDGSGLIKAFSAGREASTGQIRVMRSMQSNGYAGFTLAAPWSTRPPFAAPAICVSALAGKSDSSLDLANGGGTFCAFATTPDGLCNGDVRLGCGDLVP